LPPSNDRKTLQTATGVQDTIASDILGTTKVQAKINYDYESMQSYHESMQVQF